MSDDIPLGGRFISRHVDPEEEQEKRKHAYYCNKNALEFIHCIRAWQKHNGMKALATINPEKRGLSITTVYQQLHHGRAYLIDHPEQFTDGIDRLAKAIVVRSCTTVIRLEYLGEDYVVDSLAEAMSFGVEKMDAPESFRRWVEAGPAPNESWPPDADELILSDRDLPFFRKFKADFEAKKHPFIFRLDGQTVKVIRIDTSL